ncbi:MAG: Hsp20/alpha crystallin family protein [Spirochaetaceae bacterium]
MARELMTRRMQGRNDWHPGREIARLQDEINRLFDLDTADFAPGIFDRNVAPAVDVRETNDEYIVDVDLPGVSRDQIDISVADNVLTIKGEKTVQEKDNERHVYRCEIWSGSFQRTLSLPKAIDADAVQARMNEGVLTITLPKREEVKARSISVNVK